VGDAVSGHEIAIRLRVNGRDVEARTGTDVLLLDFLRERLGLTGTKESCGVGVCGACTVLVDGRPVSACLLLAVLARDRDVWTVEGLGNRLEEADPSGRLRRFLDVRRAFLDQEGLQCGICTPGVVVSAYALLQKIPCPTNEEIADWMAGSLCRCTGYRSILRSIRAAAGLSVDEDAEKDPPWEPGGGPRGSAGPEGVAPEGGNASV
jgi:aerobic carbon-monoxide dehydrogenase small subunit